jgi:hypothetical protein
MMRGTRQVYERKEKTSICQKKEKKQVIAKILNQNHIRKLQQKILQRMKKPG